MLEGPKLKADITTLKQQVVTYVTKDSIERMTEDVKKIRIEIADNGYEVQNCKDNVAKNEKMIDSNHKDVKTLLAELKKRAEGNTEEHKNNKKIIALLDEKLRTFIKNMQLSGGAAMAGEGNVVQEIEDNITKLREDLDEWKKHSGNERTIILNDLHNKFTKDESAMMENRIMGQFDMMIVKMKDIFPEKDVLSKRLNKLDKGLRYCTKEMEALRDKEPEPDTGMFTKKMLAQQTNCASCEKNVKNLLTGAAEHQNWNKLPFRVPGENIARYGAGFSKMLGAVRPSESQVILHHNDQDL